MRENEDGEEIKSFEELIRLLEEEAEEYPYIDDYPILIVEESKRPIIIMSPSEFEKLEKRILGEEI